MPFRPESFPDVLAVRDADDLAKPNTDRDAQRLAVAYALGYSDALAVFVWDPDDDEQSNRAALAAAYAGALSDALIEPDEFRERVAYGLSDLGPGPRAQRPGCEPTGCERPSCRAFTEWECSGGLYRRRAGEDGRG